jgi:penicillin V acylase-like amidase (Ntn superfamily)
VLFRSEYLHGKLVIHVGPQYTVMTNEPAYDRQLALNDYWASVATAMLPGTARPADRFVRASYYLKNLPKTADMRQGVAEVASVIRNVSVPLGIATPSAPNISATLWRTIADQKNLVYYYESATAPNLVWIPLGRITFANGIGVRKLDLSTDPILSGDVSKQFKPATPFAFMQVNQ